MASREDVIALIVNNALDCGANERKGAEEDDEEEETLDPAPRE